MSDYVVLSARPYDFTNDKNERITGLKLSYVNPAVKQDGVIGFEPMIASVDANFEEQLRDIPGKYQMDFEVVTGPRNKPVVQLNKIEFVSPVSF